VEGYPSPLTKKRRSTNVLPEDILHDNVSPPQAVCFADRLSLFIDDATPTTAQTNHGLPTITPSLPSVADDEADTMDSDDALDGGDADDDVAVDSNEGSDTNAETSDDISSPVNNDAPLSAKSIARAEKKAKQTRRARATALKRSKQPVQVGSVFLHYVRDGTFDTK